ncbi:MAG TPA: MFS transporter [Micromonosporaceae bacterium]|nr:MFS transporter [Micromonosporaceae bacterium]
MLRAALPARPEARRILAGTLFSAVGRGMTLPFLFIYLHQVRGLSAATVGLVVGWIGVVSLALSPVAGTLIDRFGARRVMLPCLLVEAAGVLSLAAVDSAGKAFATATAVAVGGSALWSGQSTILASLTGEEERQRVFGLQFTLVNLGIGVGGLIGGALVHIEQPGTFQLLYVLDAVGYLIPLAILLSMPAVGRRLVEPAGPDAGQPARGYGEVLRDRPFRRLFVFGLVLTTCGYAQIEIGFTAFATTVSGVSPRVIGWALAGNTLTIVLAQLFVIRILQGRSRTLALAGVGVLFAAAWLVLGLTGLGGWATRAVAAMGVVACAVVFGLGETLLSPVMPALTNALAPDELRGRYNAAGSMVWGISAIAGPVTAGPLIGAGHSGLWVVLVTAGSLVASGIALSLRPLLTPQQDGRPAAPVAAVAT